MPDEVAGVLLVIELPQEVARVAMPELSYAVGRPCNLEFQALIETALIA
jgi:hypothetical protein